ncbi:MAG: trypsin-like peptidase domain-containing protein [Chloroflexi bacterium]|nr:trypsin-like peptidase domain-containing protein [Chloroflexota bacterium]
MFPYRFDQSQPTPPAPAPAPARSPRRVGTAALLALALTGGAVGGGTVGAVAATRWLAPQASTAAAPPASSAATPAPSTASAPSTLAPVANNAPVENVAGSVYSKVNDAVVQITVSGAVQGGFSTEGSGSGFVVDASGLILTNNHVVENARAISVRFTSGETREAQVLGTDRGNDLALIKVDLPENVPVAPLGNSDQVQVGETAIAIGSPFGLDQTVTQGIISAVHRNWNPGNGRTRRNLIQTDAPINPGNSGGPLLNAQGEVIGINTMIESPVRGSVGVGFAVPINTAKDRLTQLQGGATLEPVWLGIVGQELDETIASDLGINTSKGVLVVSVAQGSPAAQVGLRGGQNANERIPSGGDVITAVDGNAVTNVDELTEQLASKKPGDTVTLSVVRNNQEQQIDVTLQAWPAEAE